MVWAYRRMLISHIEHWTNLSFLRQLKATTTLSTKINQTYLRYFGHIWIKENELEKLIIEGKINGKGTKGRSPTYWVGQIKGRFPSDTR